MCRDEEQLVRHPLLPVHPDRPSHPRFSIRGMLEKMGFPEPGALREFITHTPWLVKNRSPMIYLRHLSAQGEFFSFQCVPPVLNCRLEWKDDFEVLKEAIKHVEAQRLEYEYQERLKEVGSNPEFENRRISRSMVKHRQHQD